MGGGGIEQGPQPQTRRLPWTEPSRDNTTCPRCRCETGSAHSYCCPQASRGLPLTPPWGPPRLLLIPFFSPPPPIVCLFSTPFFSLSLGFTSTQNLLHLFSPPVLRVVAPATPPTPGHGVLLSALVQRCEPECDDDPPRTQTERRSGSLGWATVGEAGPRGLGTPCKGPQLPGQQEVGSEPGKRPIQQASGLRAQLPKKGLHLWAGEDGNLESIFLCGHSRHQGRRGVGTTEDGR